jgi:hypothetical protein
MALGCAAASARADYINDYVQGEIGIGAAHYTTVKTAAGFSKACRTATTS